VLGRGGGEFADAGIVRLPGRGFGDAPGQGDEPGVLHGVLDTGEVVVEALRDLPGRGACGVGLGGFEPPASRPRTERSDQAELQPDGYPRQDSNLRPPGS
jgi:hypothetical protein